jgi:hypothetical protein
MSFDSRGNGLDGMLPSSAISSGCSRTSPFRFTPLSVTWSPFLPSELAR